MGPSCALSPVDSERQAKQRAEAGLSYSVWAMSPNPFFGCIIYAPVSDVSAGLRIVRYSSYFPCTARSRFLSGIWSICERPPCFLDAAPAATWAHAHTHKEEIIERPFPQGKSVKQVTRETYHSARAIPRYIAAFEQVLLCPRQGRSTEVIAVAVKTSKRLVAVSWLGGLGSTPNPVGFRAILRRQETFGLIEGG